MSGQKKQDTRNVPPIGTGTNTGKRQLPPPPKKRGK